MKCVINDASFAGLNSRGPNFSEQLSALVELRDRVFDSTIVGAHFTVHDFALACGALLLDALYSRCSDPIIRGAVLGILGNSPQSTLRPCTCNQCFMFEAACVAIQINLPLLSVESLAQWGSDFFSVGCNCSGVQSIHSVRNFARRTHLSRTHFVWLRQSGATAFEQFRALAADPSGYSHRPASSYAKHVRGQTNAQRQASATNGSGQFFANGDAWIRGVEAAILSAADSIGSEATFAANGGSVHVTMRHTEMVGYSSPSGSETDSMRVEVTPQRDVHSHPR